MCRVSVVHLASMVARPVRPGIPPNGDARRDEGTARSVSPVGRHCCERAGQGSDARRR
jgi:hypothetical protein